jgi:hypothetical protein
MNVIAGALEIAVRMVMAGLPLVLAVLVLWLIVEGLREKHSQAARAVAKRAPPKGRLA